MFFNIFSKYRLPGGLVVLAMLSVGIQAAGAAQFRQLPTLPMIPPSIIFPGERDILQADLDRLKRRIEAHDRKRVDYRRECAQRQLSNAVRKRRCSALAQEIHRSGSRLRTEIGALNNRFGTIERNALQRRQPGIAPSGAAARGSTPDKRPKLIADALSAAGTWRGVLDHVKAMMDRSAGDPAVRDVSAYISGLHAGRIAADQLENQFYKHGVRRALARDHWSAALAFAQASRDTPDDLRVFASYADAAGRQHAGPACVRSGRCVSGNVALWAKRFGKRHEQSVRQIVAAGRKGKLDPGASRMLNILRAITVYAAKKDTDPTEIAAQRELIARPLAAFDRDDRLAAITGYVQLWKAMERGRAGVFLSGYGKASGSVAVRGLHDVDFPSATASRIDEGYLDVVKTAFGAGGEASPFTGKLSQSQIIRLQR